MVPVKVLDCGANECAFNSDGDCHAVAITIGGTSQTCGTYVNAPLKGGERNVIGKVGACKVESCKHNDQLLCSAPGVHIGKAGSEIDCLSFEAR